MGARRSGLLGRHRGGPFGQQSVAGDGFARQFLDGLAVLRLACPLGAGHAAGTLPLANRLPADPKLFGKRA